MQSQRLVGGYTQNDFAGQTTFVNCGCCDYFVRENLRLTPKSLVEVG